MRILFVNHAFPGMFGALSSAFAAAGHEVLFASGFRRREFTLSGVRHIALAPSRESRADAAARRAPGLEAALGAGGQALRAFKRLADMDLAPDMAIISANDGYGLFCGEAFPETFRVGWAEGQVSFLGERAMSEAAFTRHLLQCRHALACHRFVCLGTGGRSSFAARLAHGLDAPYAVNTEWFSPGGKDGPEMVLCHAGRQSVDVAVAALTDLLNARGRCHVAVLCDGREAWKNWEAARAAMPHQERVHLPGPLSLEEYRDLLRSASLLLCPYEKGLPVSILLESMSCGVAPVMKEGTGPAFLRHGQNAFFRGEEDPGAFWSSLLEERAPLAAARAGARKSVLARFDQRRVVPKYVELLLKAYQAWDRKDASLA